MLTKEQVKSIKKQLLEQIAGFPADKKEIAKQQIESMNAEQLEQFLEQNKLVKKGQGSECIFCSIIKNEIPSYKIDENKAAIAVLELNPLSKAHVLVIPKEHKTIEKLPASVLSLAKKIAKKIKNKFKPEEVRIETSSHQGHRLKNINPLYKEQKLEKKKLKDKEHQELQKKLEKKTRASRKPRKDKKLKYLPEAPIRIPN